MEGGRDGVALKHNGDTPVQILFRASVSMSRSRGYALNVDMTNLPSAVTGLSWPVDWIRIPPLVKRQSRPCA